jgi:hypothetical protein
VLAEERCRKARGRREYSLGCQIQTCVGKNRLAAKSAPEWPAGPFYWFGGGPGEKMPALREKVARHTKPNAMLKKAERPGHRVIAKNQFARLDAIDDVIETPGPRLGQAAREIAENRIAV